jgi:NADH dehydrogenase
MDRHVVIVGGGFGGLRAARILAGQKGIRLTLIDKHNYHLFQPLLYQVATAGLAASQIAVPIRALIGRKPRVQVVLGEVSKVEISKQCVVTQDARVWFYDYLVLAAGTRHSYFGSNHWEQYAPGLKSLEDASEIRGRVLVAYEKAEVETNPERRRSLLTFVVIGGGPTGVEMAGSLAEIARYTLAPDFQSIDPSSARVVLIEAGDRVLAAFDPELSARAKSDLEHMGVEVWLKSRVTNITEGMVELGGNKIFASTVIWAAGVQPSELAKTMGVELDRAGRVKVNSDLTVPGYKNVFVIGDLASFETPSQQTLPALAPVAMQQGAHAARNIRRAVVGQSLKDFRYRDKGMMATIGRKKAVMQIDGFKAGGALAWWAWVFVHIFYLIDFKNRLFVMLEWSWAYITFRKGARLIIGRSSSNARSAASASTKSSERRPAEGQL